MRRTSTGGMQRMRSGLSLREVRELASSGKNLRLNEIMGEDFLPSGCDTFPLKAAPVTVGGRAYRRR